MTVDSTGPNLSNVADLGTITSASQTLSGTSDAGSSVTVKDASSNVLGTTVADQDGNWALGVSLSAGDGSAQTLTITSKDTAGNSATDSVSYTYNVLYLDELTRSEVSAALTSAGAGTLTIDASGAHSDEVSAVITNIGKVATGALSNVALTSAHATTVATNASGEIAALATGGISSATLTASEFATTDLAAKFASAAATITSLSATDDSDAAHVAQVTALIENIAKVTAITSPTLKLGQALYDVDPADGGTTPAASLTASQLDSLLTLSTSATIDATGATGAQLVKVVENIASIGSVSNITLTADSGGFAELTDAQAEVLFSKSASVTVTGTANGDIVDLSKFSGFTNFVVTGLAEDDYIVGGNGADNINGDAGDDLLYGGAGADTIDGGDGNDEIEVGHGADIVTGGAGDDTIVVRNFQFASGSKIYGDNKNEDGTNASVIGTSNTLKIYGVNDLSTGEIYDIDIVELYEGSPSKVTMTTSQLANVTQIIGTAGASELVIVADGGTTNIDLSGVTISNLNQLTTDTGVTATLNFTQVAEIASIVSDTNAVTINFNGVTLSANLDMSSLSLASGSSTIDVDVNGNTLTLSADQAKTANVTGTSGAVFDMEVEVGAILVIGATEAVVTNVVSATELVVAAAIPAADAAANRAGMVVKPPGQLRIQIEASSVSATHSSVVCGSTVVAGSALSCPWATPPAARRRAMEPALAPAPAPPRASVRPQTEPADPQARPGAGAPLALQAPPAPLPYSRPYPCPYCTLPAHAPARRPPARAVRVGRSARGDAPPPRTKWTRRVPLPVLIGHAASLTPY